MEVEVIKAGELHDSNGLIIKKDRMRVAAYCRVSTDDEDQIKSYNSMVRHYTDLIKGCKDWVFAGVYADKAITGTKDGRDEFQKLINDSLAGKIDMIIAKSIPRFARNTLDTLKYVRMLKEHNVAVYFEVEKINTLTDGEFLLTILSSVAQQEVENTSAYVKKGLKMKMKRGELVGFQGCLGYDYDVDTKTLSINEEGAEVVRYIFNRYVSGAGSTIIARELNEQGHKTIRGNPWTTSSVMGVIKNEKYVGDIMMGKSFTVDPISKRRLENRGEEDRFYIKDHHPAIIEREVFEKATALRTRRNGSRNTVTPGKREKYARQYAFSSMLQCGFCGAMLSRRHWHSQTNHAKTIWQCSNYTRNGKKSCPHSKGIPEKIIEDAFVESYQLMCGDNNDVLNEFMKRLEDTLKEGNLKEQIASIVKSRDALITKRKMLLDKYVDGGIIREVYESRDRDYQIKIQQYEYEIDKLSDELDQEDDLQKRIHEFRKTLSDNQVLQEFDRDIFESIIEKVIVGGEDEEGNKDPYMLTFIYKTGFKQSGTLNSNFDKACSNDGVESSIGVSKSDGQHMWRVSY